jgi:phage portal protein BeeE
MKVFQKALQNAGRLWILEGGSEYKALGFYRRSNADDCHPHPSSCLRLRRFFGVPSVMIGASDNRPIAAWPASFEQQMLSFLTFTLQSYLDEWECAIRGALILRRV